jgi:hypothetical protein
MVEKIIFDNINCCRDVTKIILRYLEKNLEDFNTYSLEDVKKIWRHNGGFKCSSWNGFVEKMLPDVVNLEPLHFYCNTNVNRTVLLLCTKTEIPRCYLIKFSDEDGEIRKSIVQFLKDRKSFEPTLDVAEF